MDTSVILICSGVLGIIFGLGFLWANHRSKSMLDEWGKSNGFEILSHEERLSFTPESVTRSTYRLTVRDTAGRRRSGTARVETRFLGLLPEEIAVRWDE